MVVRLREQRNATGPVEVAETVDYVRGGEPGLLEKRPGDRKAEPELGKLIQRSLKAVERGPVRPLGDPAENRHVAVDVKVGAPRAEVQKPKSREPPGLVEVKVEDDLQGGTPAARIASR